MAHATKTLTIAECLEDAGALSLLWQSDVAYGQGYYLQKPAETLTYDFSGEHD